MTWRGALDALLITFFSLLLWSVTYIINLVAPWTPLSVAFDLASLIALGMDFWLLYLWSHTW